ncbi:MAG: exonuclease SbcCD subunit D [Acidimicrobiales bacterium]|jgi:exonuclease SbcD
MRILHTSDWHLGRSFGDHRLLEQQALFIDWLVGLVRDEEIDLIAIAGDLYDRSVPPADAVELFHSALSQLLAAGADIAAIAGNHDSAERLGSIDGLLTPGLLLRGGYKRAADVEVRSYSDGPLAIVAVPYLDPVFAPTETPETPETPENTSTRPNHETVLRHTLQTARQRISPGVRSLSIAHAFVTGAEPSESERTLAVGSAGMVSSAVFNGFSYTALGHLHRAQTVGDDERVRYSGAPLAYSFGETSQKEVVLIELDARGNAQSKPIPIDVGRSVATVRGTLDELLAANDNDQDWVRVELTNTHPVADAHRRLRHHFPHLVEIARIGARPNDRARLTVQGVRERSVQELASEFLTNVSSDNDPDDLTLLQTALSQVESRRL